MEIFDEKTGIWQVNNGDFHLFDKSLAEALGTFFKYRTVVDLGCGMGDYLKSFKELGILCDGFDGNPNTKKLTNGLCETLDLSKDIELPVYEWAFSLEVGEHIPAEFEDTFINNLHKVNSRGIVLSWAVEGQAGIGHVNCHNNDYVIDKIEKLGYSYNQAMSHWFRNKSTFPYFKNTIMVFNRKK
jgi:hypothetical protein